MRRRRNLVLLALVCACLVWPSVSLASPCPPDELPRWRPAGLQPRSGPLPNPAPTPTPRTQGDPTRPPAQAGGVTAPPRPVPGGRAGTTPTRTTGGTTAPLRYARKAQQVSGPGSFDWRTWWEYHKELILYRASRRYVTDQDMGRFENAKLLDQVMNDVAIAVESKSGDADDTRLRAEASLALTRSGHVVPLEALRAAIVKADKDQSELAARALMSLATHADPRAEGMLRGVLADGAQPYVIRAIAAAGLGVFGNPSRETVELLMDVSRTAGHDDLHAACFFSLGALGTPESVAYMKDRLANDKSFVRQAALLSALSMSHDPGVAPLLLERTRSLDYQVRWSAITGLGELLDGTGRLTSERAEDAGYSAKELAPVRQEMSRQLEILTRKGGDDRVRAFAAIALGRIGGDENIDALTRLARDTKGHLRSAVCIALALAAAPEGEKEMVRLFLDKSETATTRAGGALALGLHGNASPSARRAMQSGVAAHHPDVVRRYAAIGLGLLHDIPSTAALTKALHARNASEKLRIGVARGLALTGTPSALDAVTRAIDAEQTTESKIAFLRALGACPNPKPLEYLESIVAKDPTSDLGAVAVHVIGHLEADHRPPPFAKYLCAWNYFLRFEPFDLLHDFI